MTKSIDARIAAETSWALTEDRSARTRPGRQAFLKRFETEVDPDGKLSPEERRIRADHALRAYMLRLSKNATQARRIRNELEGEARMRHRPLRSLLVGGTWGNAVAATPVVPTSGLMALGGG